MQYCEELCTLFGEVTAGPTGCRTWADGEKRDVLQMHSLRRIQALPALTAYTGGRIQGTLRNTADSADHQGPGIGRPQHRPRSYGSDASRSATQAVHAAEGNRKRRRHKTTQDDTRRHQEKRGRRATTPKPAARHLP